MTVFAFRFDRNKELNYPFLGTRVIRWSRFFNDFTTRVNSYIGTTIVVPDTSLLVITSLVPRQLYAADPTCTRRGDVIHPQLRIVGLGTRLSRNLNIFKTTKAVFYYLSFVPPFC